jgi:phytoene/squalene synthetase
VLLASLRAWLRDTRREIPRLPREQQLTSAVLPAVSLRRVEDD